jgi:hypothetical protein
MKTLGELMHPKGIVRGTILQPPYEDMKGARYMLVTPAAEQVCLIGMEGYQHTLGNRWHDPVHVGDRVVKGLTVEDLQAIIGDDWQEWRVVK